MSYSTTCYVEGHKDFQFLIYQNTWTSQKPYTCSFQGFVNYPVTGTVNCEWDTRILWAQYLYRKLIVFIRLLGS